MNIYLFLSIGLIVLSVYLGHVLARRKGLNPVFWGVMGGIFGPFMLPFLLLTKSRRKVADHD
jgi:hypothetical protein